MDTLTRERRSWNMSRIKGRDTKPELLVRSVLHRLGYRFRLHQKKLPGRPDLVLPKHRTVVFVHGCFWHRHPRCRYAYTPKSNIAFWTTKFEQNVARDREARRALRKAGWRVVVIWECQAKDAAILTARLKTAGL
jgi:DNA mismatch endonuclease (patch repair protein)